MHPSQDKGGSDHPPPRRILTRLNLFFLCAFLLLALVYMVRERLHENAIRKVLPALRAIDLGCEGISDAEPDEAREHFELDPAGRIKVPGEGPLSGPESAELAEILELHQVPSHVLLRTTLSAVPGGPEPGRRLRVRVGEHRVRERRL